MVWMLYSLNKYYLFTNHFLFSYDNILIFVCNILVKLSIITKAKVLLIKIYFNLLSFLAKKGLNFPVLSLMYFNNSFFYHITLIVNHKDITLTIRNRKEVKIFKFSDIINFTILFLTLKTNMDKGWFKKKNCNVIISKLFLITVTKHFLTYDSITWPS